MPNDTHPKVERVLLAAYQRMTPAQKFARVAALNETVLQMAAARIRKQYSPKTDRELRLRVAALWLDDQTMRRAFNWDPAVEGR